MNCCPLRMMLTRAMLVVCLLFGAVSIAKGEGNKADDPAGILRKPIPDKLVVLTFDDGPVSGYTVVAPILKSFGFGGSFYVCDFDSFKTRKDWYLTWRQMKALADDGFEIGNHSVGHTPGFNGMMAMEDALLANNVPKPTTIAWPLHHANVKSFPDFAANGYIFARGGHNRPYRPMVDNPFEIPSMWGSTIEQFVKNVRHAAGGKIVVLCYHGVPDMEHPGVSLSPEVFKAQMQYLKDNHYKVIALRVLVEYIDPVKAAKLPSTVRGFKEPGPVVLAGEIKPHAAPNVILRFGFPNQHPGRISGTKIHITAPYALDLAAIAPNIRIPDGAAIVPGHRVARNFTKPQTYTLTCKDGSKKTYTVTVRKLAASRAKNMLTFAIPGVGSIPISDATIGVYVPMSCDLTKLAPTFTVSRFARAVPASGTPRDFTRPQTYTVTAQDGSKRVYTVKAVKVKTPNVFTWKSGVDGKWSDASRWSSNLAAGSAPLADGKSDYILNFNRTGKCNITHDLKKGFSINQLNLGDDCRGMVLDGKSVIFAMNRADDIRPAINAAKCQRVDINTPIILRDDLNVNTFPGRDPNCFISFNDVISGRRALVLNSFGDPNVAGINFHDVHFGILQINNSNTYSGGTRIHGGKINVRKTDGLGTGPVKLDNFGTLSSRAALANPLVINSGTLFHCNLSGPVKLNGIAGFIGNCNISGPMSGAGGFTMFGINGRYLSMRPGGVVTLHGANTYTGPTIVFPGALIVKKAAGLYNGDTTKWTPANITVHQAATLRLNVGGPGEFTGAQISALLANLTRRVNHNGLMGGSVLYLDIANADGPIVLTANITDSKGPGGGAFTIKKNGPGVLKVTGENSYSGRTVFENGTLIVASLNSVEGGKPSSSLGAPSSLYNGIIPFGGDCTLKYTGKGETTDRIIDLAGKKQTVSFDQSGGGLLKFTSPFDISGYGHSKTLVLKGSTAGAGELVGNIKNPYDRKKVAITSLTKTGTGTWILSGVNSFTGPMMVMQGMLCLTNAHSLSANTEVTVAQGATLDLRFKGQMQVSKLSLGGKAQSAGQYSAADTPNYIKGTGVLNVKLAKE